jgi:hypothetical protein
MKGSLSPMLRLSVPWRPMRTASAASKQTNSSATTPGPDQPHAPRTSAPQQTRSGDAVRMLSQKGQAPLIEGMASSAKYPLSRGDRQTSPSDTASRDGSRDPIHRKSLGEAIPCAGHDMLPGRRKRMRRTP